LEQKDADAHEAFMCIAMNKLYDDPNRLRHSVHEFYLKSPQQMAMLYADIPEAIANTQEIAQKCDLTIKLGDPTPPNFKFVKEYAQKEGLKDIVSDEEYFIYQCQKGLESRLKIVPEQKHDEYRKRLEIEMDIINKMKFPGYMLIVWDFVREAKKRSIPVGPGRGSAAGSLVSYALEITDIDPMKYDLLFERFLNPERVSMPDIDMDFCQHRRQEIIDYVVDKYGRANVAQIITFGKLLAKGVIRDVARVLGMPYEQADKMAKLIPDELKITLEDAYKKEPKIKQLTDENPTAKKVWEFALALEGLNRNAGTHAAGVVISNDELWHKTPLFKPSGTVDTLATQYSGKYVEDVDLIKFDFLGLKTLTVIDNALKLIQNRYDKIIDFNQADVDDPKIYKLIQSGHTLGLFQIESQGMQKLNSELKPSNFEDIIAVLALYRPGPMESGMITDFIKRKHGLAQIEYAFDSLEPILKPTYGVIVYQEQVMQIVQTIGGFSLGGADLVRRAMGKKIKEEMDKLKQQFIDGAVQKGYDGQKSSDLFDLIVKFAGYGFNKSHSAAYAMITFYTAYLKAYYPQEFMAALLTSEKDNTDKIVRYVDELKRLKIDLSPPDINLSELEFSATKIDGKDVVLFGLGAIKGAGEVAIKQILQTRHSDGPFKDLSDFISRIDSSKVNKKVIESLIKAGALDCFEYSRKSMLFQVEKIIESANKAATAKKMAENSLFGDDEDLTTISIELEHLDEYIPKQILEFEKSSLGFYVSGHPLDEYREELENIDYTLSSDIEHIKDGSEALFIGKIEDIVTKIGKKGSKFGLVKLLDLHGDIELMVFSRMLDELEMADREKPIGFKVKVDKNENFNRITTKKIVLFENAKKEGIKSDLEEKIGDKVQINIDIESSAVKLEKVKELALAHKGNRPLEIIITSKLEDVIIPTAIMVSDGFLSSLKDGQL
jgi:DNA polymerase-3 subunit alpha